jgi:cytoskeleton protein RodZ
MTTETTVPPDAEPAMEARAIGPGGQLRQARLDLKLAPDDVANILRLSSRQIVALEADDYANLPGPTYVRGYLRGYAQLLGVSPEPVVEAYNRLVAARKPVDLAKLAPKREIRSDHQLIKFATAGVAAIVLGLSAVWWQEQEPATAPPVPLTSSAPVDADVSEASESGVSETTPAEIPPTAVVTGPVVATKAEPIIPAPAPRAAPPAPAPVVPPTVVTGPRGRLVMQTTLDSWVDVRDANGNRLLYEVVPTGRTVAIEGVTPLAVFLGNADGVRVEFNGEVFDTVRHRRGDIARFTLGEPVRTP